MVIGNGLLAQRFSSYKDDNGCIVFASGVSNSTNKIKIEFAREQKLLTETLSEYSDKTVVYFGTCSVYDPGLLGSAYVKHKLAMEELIRKHSGSYHVFRISNLAGQTNNPHTVLNYFAQHIQDGSSFNLWLESFRNIIDIDDAFLICDYIIQHQLFLNKAINIANPRNYPVSEIVRLLELHTGKKANYKTVHKESKPDIDVSRISEIIAKLNINFDAGYLQRTIEKYFPKQ